MRWIRDGGLPLSPPLPLPLFLPSAWCSLIFTSVKERPRRLSALIDSDTWGSVLRLRIRERRASWNVEGGRKDNGERAKWKDGEAGTKKKKGIKQKAEEILKNAKNVYNRRLKQQERGKSGKTESRQKVKSEE